ncbi:unnamed protein product [Bursaphelenchus okinawaensis]|uniref:Transporter n=1 Tax=Bursaphelenchus okinawaensis TaxID=465554 RepID=A0A811LKP1_9BILA|nr:unnamed protein product [Bursaphelenchus okinawaensis]CAG9124249.1 unnamed protein product [Bursaphelenchus okinawaensis]
MSSQRQSGSDRNSKPSDSKASHPNGSNEADIKTAEEHTSMIASIQRTVSFRQTWSNGIQFILTCTSYAVGLGNIWRFPAVVYKNGGGAFLVPYFFCSMIIGFPVLYMELCLGQFARAGPAVVYGRMRPLLQGLGWAMVTMSAFVTIFYNMVVAWAILYLYIILSGQSYKMWSSCHNDHNTDYCTSPFDDDACRVSLKVQNAFMFKRACYTTDNVGIMQHREIMFSKWSPMTPAEEFFEYFILEKAKEVGTYGMNWKLFGAYSAAWLMTASALSKGTKIIGYLSYLTATLPYIIMLILFMRAVWLDGAYEGMKYYILEPDLNVIYNPNAWREAATQVCFSLSVGFGGILSFSSFNPTTQNVFRDAMIVTVADATMSVIGGTAVFSVLGFMSKEMNTTISEVVQDGTALAFVAYPEALIRMPIEPLWSFLFFLMVFLLGISSQFGYTEAPITAFIDQFPKLKRYHTTTVFVVCTMLFCCGIILCTNSGFFFFNILNDYSSGFALGVALFMETILVSYIYGMKDWVADLRSMFGPPKHRLGQIFGRTGYYVKTIWMFISPIMWLIVTGFTLYMQSTNGGIVIGKGTRRYQVPAWCTAIGWFISMLPLIHFPMLALINYLKFSRKGKPASELLRVQRKWPSYNRHKKRWRRRKREIGASAENEQNKSSSKSKRSSAPTPTDSNPNTLSNHADDPFEEQSDKT